MRRGIFISVRTGSERLPNKSILKIKDKFTIEYVIDSVKKSNYADKIILCTTKNSQDDILCDIAKKCDIDFYRGDEHNKFKRWYWASVEFDIDEIVTADGDVYGFKSKTIENVINISRGDVVEPHEIVSFLQDKNFKIHKLKNKFDVFEKKNIRMTLDYEEDFQFFKTIIENLQEDYTFEDILNYIDNNKSIKDINYFREVDWKNNQ